VSPRWGPTAGGGSVVELESIDGYPQKVEDCYGRGSQFVYILQLFDGRWYIGQTKAPKRRVVEHARGRHACPDFVKRYPPVAVESVIEFETRSRALERETEIAEAFAHYYGESRVHGGGL